MLFTEKLKIEIIFFKVQNPPVQGGPGGGGDTEQPEPLPPPRRGRGPGSRVRGRGEAWAGPSRLCARGGAGGAAAAAAAAGRSEARGPERANAVPARAAASVRAPLTPLPEPDPAGRRMGARASGGPRARAGLLLLLLLLGLLAPGARGARGRGGTEKNSYRRTVNTFSQSVSSLFGEDNVRAAQKVGAGPAPAVTLPGSPRTWRRGPAWATRGLRGCRPAGAREEGCPGRGRGCPTCAPGPAACGPPSCPASVGSGGRLRRGTGAQGLGAPSAQRAALLLGPCPLGPRARGPPLGFADAGRASHSFIQHV